MQTTTPIEAVLKRDRTVVIGGVVAVAAIAWGYTIYVAQSSADMGMSMGMAGPQRRPHDSAVRHGQPQTPRTVEAVRLHRRVPVRVLGRLVSVCSRCHSRQLGPAPGFVTDLNDGWKLQRLPGGWAATDGRSLPVEPPEVCLPDPLPQSARFSDVRLARGYWRGFQDGSTARKVLPGMLLGPYGAALRAGGDEPGVDRRPGGVCPGGEGRSGRRKSQPCDRSIADGLGRLGRPERRPLNL